MKELREMIREMDYEDKKDIVEGLIGWSSLFILCFMLSVIFG